MADLLGFFEFVQTASSDLALHEKFMDVAPLKIECLNDTFFE